MRNSTKVKFYFALGILALLLCFGLWTFFVFCYAFAASLNKETLHSILGTFLFVFVCGFGAYCIASVLINYKEEGREDLTRR